MLCIPQSPEVKAFADQMLAGYGRLNPVVITACTLLPDDEEKTREIKYLAGNYAELYLVLPFLTSISPSNGALEILATDLTKISDNLFELRKDIAPWIESVRAQVVGDLPLHPKFHFPIMSKEETAWWARRVRSSRQSFR